MEELSKPRLNSVSLSRELAYQYRIGEISHFAMTKIFADLTGANISETDAGFESLLYTQILEYVEDAPEMGYEEYRRAHKIYLSTGRIDVRTDIRITSVVYER